MLMLVNPFNVLFREGILNVSSKLLTSDISYNVLDTDDLIVETVSYEQLYDAIMSGVGIINVKRWSDDRFSILYCGWDFHVVSKHISSLRGCILWEADDVVINGNTYSFSVERTSTGHYVLQVNGLPVYRVNGGTDEFVSARIHYFYIVGDYLIVRLSFEPQRVRAVFATIFSLDGELIDVIQSNSNLNGRALIASKDVAFSTKFALVYNERY